MEIYEELVIEVTVFEKEDVIVTSGDDDTETPSTPIPGGGN